MAAKIGYQDGIEAARLALHRLDPPPDTDEAWADKLASTLKTLKQGHNEHGDRLDALEARLSQSRPFFP